jgi:hypothetical protein
MAGCRFGWAEVAQLTSAHPREGGDPGDRSLIEGFVQVEPLRIALLNHPDLPGAVPFLDLPLASERCNSLIVDLVPDQNVDSVLGCETFELFFFMLPNAAADLIGMTAIQGPVSAAREQAGVERHVPSPLVPRLRGDERYFEKLELRKGSGHRVSDTRG